jgi:endoglucanase
MLLLLLIGMAQVTQAQVTQTAADENGQLSVLGTCIINKNKDTVQLRGMSFYWSQWQAKYYTYNTVKWLRDDWKCNIVRAAMGVTDTVGGYTKSAEIAAVEKQKVITVADAAIDLGMYVIIDWHTHYGLTPKENIQRAARGELGRSESL